MSGGKVIVWGLIAVVVVGLAGLVWWYVSVPHTAESQFAYAESLEKVLRGDALTKSTKELEPQIEAVIEQYKRVEIRFGKSAKAAEAQKRIAKLQEEVAKDVPKALASLDELIAKYPEEENTGFGLLEEARLLKGQANELKGEHKPEAEVKYKDALAKLEEYRKTFEKGKDADGALMEIGRIWQEGLEEPLIHQIETFEKVLKNYPEPDNKYRDEAIYRLAKAYEKAKEYPRALALYGQLLEEFPKSKWAPDALYARGKLLADQMEKHDEAAKDFARLQQEFPDSPMSGQAGAQARSEGQKAAADEGDTYGKSRYGGTMPYDTVRDKALPPSGMFQAYAAQKLDAENYELEVDFSPAESRITVNGTMKFVNRGEEKKELLLMLGPGLNVSTVTLDGVAAESKHNGESWKVVLPTAMKKDAEGTLGFAYTGQYTDPKELAKMMEAMSAGARAGGGRGRPATAPASGPASAPTTAPETKPALPPAPKYTTDMQMGLGEFGYALSGASWYPITIIGDVFTGHVTMKTPPNMEAVSNGAVVRREKSTREGEPGVFEFKTAAPVFGLYFAYGPYVVQEKKVGGIDYYTYFKPGNAAKHDAYIAVTDRILSFYGSKFAGFPYEKMAMVEVPLPPMLGGVGPASLMFLQETIVAHKDVPENLLAHELAHQWFGNLVPINITDPNYSQWMSEGFATYCDALYTEHTDGPKALAMHIQKYGQLFFQLWLHAPRGSGAIKDTFMNSGLYRPVIYEKGAIVLHMLRKVMGDEKFFQLMRQFVETYKNKPTKVDDFRRMAGTVYGEDLSWFFSQWIDQSIFAHWKVDAAVSGGEVAGEPVKVKITITQPDDLVKMPADVALIGPLGERHVLANQMLDKKEQVIEATPPFKPVKIVVDEDYWVLRHPGSDNIWTSEKQLAPASAPK